MEKVKTIKKAGDKKPADQPKQAEQTNKGIVPVQADDKQMEAIRNKIIGDQFNGKFREALQATPFPMDVLDPSWYEAARTAVRFMSPIGSGLSWKELADIRKALNDGKPQLNLFQFSIVSNTMESRSQNDLQMNDAAFDNYLAAAEAGATKWNGICTPLRSKVIADITASIQIKSAPGNFGMQAVKAEA